MDNKYKLSENVMLNNGDQKGIVFVSNGNSEDIFYLNDVSVSVIMFLSEKGEVTLSEIISHIMNLYDVKLEQCTEDISEFINSLLKMHIIEYL